MRAKYADGDWRPLIEVTLTMGGVSQQVWMMVDTGADRTTIPPDLAKALTGKDPAQLGDPGPPIRGMGDKTTPSRVTDATVTYRGRSLDMKIWIAITSIPVLGRNDFMKRFHCHFYWDRSPPEWSIEPAPLPKGTPAPVWPPVKAKKRR